MSYTADNITKNAFSMFDMMIGAQRLGLKAMSIYQPLVSTLLNVAPSAPQASSSFGAARSRFDANEEQVIGVGEEVLNVGTRMVPGKTTRVRRVVVQKPVHQDVTLHTETVILERRKPILTSGSDMLTEVTVEMSDFNEVPVVSKSVHLVEEVLLRKEVTSRTETIHDTVRRDTLEIEQPSNLPVVVHTAPKQEKPEEMAAGEVQDKKQPGTSLQVGNKPGDQKRS
jgi:stress response protein YsnF